MTDILSQTDPEIELIVEQIQPSPVVTPPSANFVTSTNFSDGRDCDPCARPGDVCPGQECAGSDQHQIKMLLIGVVVVVRIPTACICAKSLASFLVCDVDSGPTTCDCNVHLRCWWLGLRRSHAAAKRLRMSGNMMATRSRSSLQPSRRFQVNQYRATPRPTRPPTRWQTPPRAGAARTHLPQLRPTWRLRLLRLPTLGARSKSTSQVVVHRSNASIPVSKSSHEPCSGRVELQSF